jgi:CHAT domain-containing protein
MSCDKKLMFETEEELIQEYVDSHFGAAGRAFPIPEKDSVSPAPKIPEKAYRKYFSRGPLFIAVLLIVLISSLGWFYFSRNSIDRQTTAALDNAYTNGRLLESRISGLKYAPFTITRGEKKEENSGLLFAIELKLLEAVIKDRSAGNLHALGRLYLAKQEFEKATGQLEEAKTLAPNDARILSDLGTAYLEKSRTIPDEQGGQQLKMRAMALEEFEKAVETNPKIPEAVFNRAICRQLLSLPFQARQGWQEYLDLDPASKWAEEARMRREKSETAISAKSKTSDELLQDFMAAYHSRDDDKAYQTVSRNREMITGKLIPQRLAKLITESEGDQRTEYLSALEYIGKLENERSGDPFWAEMAKFYSSASKETLTVLREAQGLVFRGYETSSKGDHAGALKAFQDAQAIFKSNGDNWAAGICGYWIGYALNRRNRLPESTDTLEQLLEPNKRYKWLSSQCLNWLAFNMAVKRQYSKAIDYSQKALDLSEKTGDIYLSQKTRELLTIVYQRLGQQNKALDNVYKNLEPTRSPGTSLRQKWRDIDSVAGLFFSLKLYRTSAAYENEALDLATGPLDEKTFVIEASIKLGRIYSTLGKYDDAFASLDRAQATAENLGDEQLSLKSIAAIRLQRGHIYRETGNCTAGLQEYDEATTFYDRDQFPVSQYEAHKGRLRCYLANNDTAALQTEFPVILGLFRENRSNIIEEQNRNTFFENEQDIYDLAVDYEFRNQNPETAFDYSEESRARSLLDMQRSPLEVVVDNSLPEIKFSAAVTEPAKLSTMQSEIPENVQIVQYSVLSNKTLIWVVTRETVKVVSSPVQAQDLREKVSTYLEMIRKHDPSNTDKTIEKAQELYGILIGPVKEWLDPDKYLCIIPDKILFRLPFSALISPESNKYFLAEHTFVSAPSLNIFLNSTRKAALLAHSPSETVLSIGNPSFDKKEFENLASLESTALEADKVAGLYDSNFLLTGENAVKERVRADMPKVNVIHFGGHYIVNEGSPLLSGFILSENLKTHKREDSILTNYEILGDSLSNTRLIVLAACETGVEQYYSGEGMIGASRTFLAAGVPLVVASQWAVDSEPTAELMVRFHRYRKTGNLSTARALRRAQLDMLEGDFTSYRDPYYWAGFLTFGGYAQF